jgi:hypothetical protein
MSVRFGRGSAGSTQPGTPGVDAVWSKSYALWLKWDDVTS